MVSRTTWKSVLCISLLLFLSIAMLFSHSLIQEENIERSSLCCSDYEIDVDRIINFCFCQWHIICQILNDDGGGMVQHIYIEKNNQTSNLIYQFIFFQYPLLLLFYLEINLDNYFYRKCQRFFFLLFYSIRIVFRI